MATITSVGSGLWSVAGTWDAGVPSDGDTVVIAAGHTIEFNVDQSAFVTGISLTLSNANIGFKLTRTAGTYCLKLAGNTSPTPSATCTLDFGTLASPIPEGCFHRVEFTDVSSGGWNLVSIGAGLLSAYGANPVNKYAILTGNEAIGQTRLEIDRNLSSDIWHIGDEIRVCEITTYEAEDYVIAGIGADYIDIVGGLTVDKSSGAYIILLTRNIVFYKPQSTSWSFFRYYSKDTPITISSCYLKEGGSTAFFQECKNIQVEDCIVTASRISNNSLSSRLHKYEDCIITKGLNATDTDSTFVGLSESIFLNCLFVGRYKTLFPSIKMVKFYNCNFLGVQRPFWLSSNIELTNCLFRGCTTANIFYSNGILFNCTILDGAEPTFGGMLPWQLLSINHNGVGGTLYAWDAGGKTITQSVVIPTGYSASQKTTLSSKTRQSFWQREYTISPGASVNIETQLRKDASMTYLPRAIVFNKASTDPFAGGVGLHTFTMTDSVNTWESDLYTYTNSGTEDVTLVIRIQGMNATGNLYSALDVEQINVDLTGAIAKIDVIDGLVDLIKAKTDQLAFTVANQVDANSLTGGLTEGQIRAAIGLAAANLDTQLAVIPTAVENRQEMDSNSTRLASIDGKTTNLPADPADQSAVEAAITAIPAGISVNDILGMQVEGTYTLQQILRIMSSALAGKLSGGGTATLKFRDLQDTLDRITATVDQATGDRDNITLDLS